jgi:hypothetical protein
MFKRMFTLLVILSVAGIGVADAASKRKPHKTRAIPPTLNEPARPTVARTPGPPWAGPGECYTDDGYGRYVLCGAGKE